MKFPAKGSSDFEICPAGNHVGICNAIVDLGMQPGSRMYPDPKHKVYVRFELPSERISYEKDGQKVEGPMSIGATFTASMGTKANLRKFIESWFGKPFPTDEAAADFDMKNLLGRRCLLNVTHTDKDGKTYANIATATPLPKGMVSNETQHNASLFFDLDDPATLPTYNSLPKWLQEKIAKRVQVEQHEKDPGFSPEDTAVASGDPDDDIPF